MQRRDFIRLGLCTAGLAAWPRWGCTADAVRTDLQAQLLALAEEQQRRRRERFAAVSTPQQLAELQGELRASFLKLLGEMPGDRDVPPVRKLGQIEAEDYSIEKLLIESFPGYFVPALLYKPRRQDGPRPGVISPCGHSAVGKAATTYQMLHVNLALRGYVVLTYDPVGQGERSQFWDADRGQSRYNLLCGEHAVLGNPLYLLGSSLAKYRIWDGLRALDYLASRGEVDRTRLACVGNSGGGTLTAYIAALDPRVAVAAICCYITTLPLRMANRIEADPDADPEQDIFGFVSEGIDHAGLLALRAPRPTLLGAARFDYFPIEGTRESFAEARRLYAVAGAADKIARVEAAERHGLSLPLREGVYDWFDRHLLGRADEDPVKETAVQPRPARELLVCPDGQVNLSQRSRPLLPMALEQFERRPKRPLWTLRELLQVDLAEASPEIATIAEGASDSRTTVLCINGNETPDWRKERGLLDALAAEGHAVQIVDPRGAGQQRLSRAVKGHDYADPLCGVEENVAYNAFLVGKSLMGMRVSDVLAAVQRSQKEVPARRVVLCARGDAALVALFAAAVELSISRLAVEDLRLSYRGLFAADAMPINAASIVPGLLAHVGDLPEVLAKIAPRKVLISAAAQAPAEQLSAEFVADRFTARPRLLLDWLGR